MGDSLPPPSGIDLVNSYARLRAGDNEVELVLSEPKAESAASATQVLLARDEKTVTGSATLSRDGEISRLVCRVPRAPLADGIWSVTLSGSAGDEPVDARLLVQGRRPLVLLWGATTRKSHQPAARGGAAAVATLDAAPPTKQLVATLGGRALDAALSPLPAERAQRIRAGARRTARRLLR